MKLTTLRAGCLAGFPASGVLLASQVPVSSSSRERSVQHLPESMSYREWKTLLGRARTPEEFHALAQYCWSRANQYRQKQAACETAMRSSASPSPQPAPKHLTQSQTLSGLRDHYTELARHWQELGESLSASAAGLQSADSPK